jgi:hypothetical protein
MSPEKITNFLSETIKEFKGIRDKLNKVNGLKADTVKQKLCSCFSKNKGVKGMCEISYVSVGEDLVDSEDLSVGDILCYNISYK